MHACAAHLRGVRRDVDLAAVDFGVGIVHVEGERYIHISRRMTKLRKRPLSVSTASWAITTRR
eukprot:1997056-Pleurochrysis_carterae.AAC.3